jgi:hypothetical protein
MNFGILKKKKKKPKTTPTGRPTRAHAPNPNLTVARAPGNPKPPPPLHYSSLSPLSSLSPSSLSHAAFSLYRACRQPNRPCACSRRTPSGRAAPAQAGLPRRAPCCRRAQASRPGPAPRDARTRASPTSRRFMPTVRFIDYGASMPTVSSPHYLPLIRGETDAVKPRIRVKRWPFSLLGRHLLCSRLSINLSLRPCGASAWPPKPLHALSLSPWN